MDDTEFLDFQWDTAPEPVYANELLVADVVDIFSLAFAEVRPESDAERGRDGKLLVPAHVVASIRMPPSAMPEVVEEVVRAWNAYVAAQSPTERKKLKTYQVASSTRKRS
ncbi:MAG: hypothetical protein Q8S73_33125 [Deltaproteobacteria bacterium]|nr:hypothetical protein [Myxococcales bacterium]MDP3218989.1 hypothetical protein [Deltaproteobacteria bacterium]